VDEGRGAFTEAKRAADVADAGWLRRVTNCMPTEGAGCAVRRSRRAGNGDYKKVPALQGLDLSLYRGRAREVMRVTATTS
jgi:hypothetical protein